MSKTTFIALPFFAAALTFGFFQFCVQPPNYPDEPVIEFLNLSKNVLLQKTLGQDSLLVVFSFTDGDGDLGTVNGEPNIFVQDGRDSFDKPPYQIPYIEPQGAGNGISGEISIAVPTTCCIYPANTGIPPCDASQNAPQITDTLFFRIRIQDQAGHYSNWIETTPITLICRQ